ncbi:hypothetical protein, partial [Glutamicibacter protophormiae]|uniref:hypothetical protein n=1 Tax=Glutamicibacter protophormiae TaxID=37930 RepID=UPI003BAE721B
SFRRWSLCSEFFMMLSLAVASRLWAKPAGRVQAQCGTTEESRLTGMWITNLYQLKRTSFSPGSQP